MYSASFSPRFERDVKSRTKRHWNSEALKTAIADLLNSDEKALGRRCKNPAFIGKWQGYRAMHVNSAPNPARDQWVLVYKFCGGELVFVRTGTHEEVHGKKSLAPVLATELTYCRATMHGSKTPSCRESPRRSPARRDAS